MSDKLLTPDELAQKLGATKSRILDWRRAGIIPAAIHRGNFIRFDLADVMEALKADAKETLRKEQEWTSYT